MRERRRLKSKHLIEDQMLRRGREPFLTSDDVRDFHEVIIYYIGKVIGGIAIRLNQDLIVEDIIIENDAAMHHVLPLAHAMRYEHTDHSGFPACQAFFDLCFTEVIAEPVIFGGLMLLSALLDSQLLQSKMRL